MAAERYPEVLEVGEGLSDEDGSFVSEHFPVEIEGFEEWAGLQDGQRSNVR